MDDAVEVAAGAGLEVGAAERVGDRDEGALHHVVGDAEQLGRLLLLHEVERRVAASQAAGAGRQLEAPHRREQRAPLRACHTSGSALSVRPSMQAITHTGTSAMWSAR